MPAGGGMDFTYGQQHEVTGGPDAGEKSRPRARETAATYKNQFMSASLSKKVVGIARVANFQELKDTSDLKELSAQDALFLKPIAQMNISVSIPASHLQPMTDVANPVIDCAAAIAHSFVSAVMIIRLPYILNASANVSTISVDFIFIPYLFLSE